MAGLGVRQWTDTASLKLCRLMERTRDEQWVEGDQGRVSEEVFEQRSEDSMETGQVTREQVSLHGHSWTSEGRFLLDCGVHKGRGLKNRPVLLCHFLSNPTPFLLCFPSPASFLLHNTDCGRPRI